jgi:hypothetical protein
MQRTVPLLVVALHNLTAPTLALADGNAKAEALFREGRKLLASGKLSEACAAFDASQRLEPATTTVFNQADCREKNGQLATAWGAFVDAERQTRGAADETGARMHKVAVERAGRLEPRLSKLTIHVGAPPSGLVVRRGSEVVDPVEWNRALPIDGGTYEVTASLGDRQVWSETLTIGVERDAHTVEVTIPRGARTPERTPVAPATPQAVAPATRQAVAPATPQAAAPVIPSALSATRATAAPARTRSNLLPIGVSVGAGVLLVGALAFDWWGDNTYDDAVAHHDIDEWNSANTRRYAAEGLLAAGIGCAGVAAYLWLHDRGGSSHTTTAAAIAPVAGSGQVGLQLRGRW